MSYTIFVSPTAVEDLQDAIDYYNEKAESLGYRFADLVDEYFKRIASVPTASAIRYKDVRGKPMTIFPYLIMYTIDQDTFTVNILRIFNTWQEPL
ncbi:MAG: type II toxin-antitoxin system RelE/ParE family toxin [Ginsengibacter sp.]